MKESCFFISDLHLSEKKPVPTRIFFSFLEHFRSRGKTLYILGDLFDLWVGPRQMSHPYYEKILQALSELVQGGKREIFLLRGNRDMYLGSHIEKKWGISVLEDTVIREIGKRKVYLTHGDLLCSNDRKYLLARRIFRSAPVKIAFQALPMSLCLYLAEGYRGHSDRVVSNKTHREKELVFTKVKELFLQGIDVIICGHVHRARRYTFFEEGRKGTLFTLGGWETTGSYIAVNKDFSLATFKPAGMKHGSG